MLTMKYRSKDGQGEEGSGSGQAVGRAPAEEMKAADFDQGRDVRGRGGFDLPQDGPNDGGGELAEDPVDEEVADEGEEDYQEDYEEDGDL